MAIRFETKNIDIRQKVQGFIEKWQNLSEDISVKTSGSTGSPKEIHLLKKHMIASAKATGKFLNLKKGDTALLCLSMDTIAGRMMVVRSIVLELELIVTDLSSNPLTNINEKIDFAAMVPMQIQKILQESPGQLKNIHKLIIGGGPVSHELMAQIQSIQTIVYHTFGMTETISHIAMRRLNHPLEIDFKCLPEIRISEKHGSLVIDAPALGVQQLETNDVIELISPTSFRWLGRRDFTINSGGIKIQPEEIESKLEGLITFPFFVYGEPDEFLGEKLILVIEHPENLNLSKRDFQSHLPKYSIPKEIRYVAHFEYTKSGKIQRLTTKELPNVAREVL